MPDNRSWLLAAGCAVLGVSALIVIYANTSLSMLDLWSRMHAFDHAFLILPVCLYLIWERRHRLAQALPVPSLVGMALLAGFGALWMVADVIDITIGRQFALIGMVESMILAVLGWRMFFIMLFPMGFLWLVLPTDLELLPVLQRFATIFSSSAIRMMGIPVFVEDVFIELPSKSFWVAPGCSGLNFLLSGFALSILYAEMIYTSWTKRILCVLVMIVAALAANVVRIIGLIVASHYLNDVYDINDHYLEGWLLFASVMFILMWVGWRFRDPVPEATPEPVQAAAGKSRRSGPAGIIAALVVAVAISAFYPAYASYRLGNTPAPAAVQIEFPQKVGEWERVATGSTDWNPEFAQTDAQQTARYMNGAKWIDLYVAYYAYQGSGREVAAHGNRVYDDKSWKWLRSGQTEARYDAADITVSTVLMRAKLERRAVWHTYWIDGRYTDAPIVAKLLQAKAEMLTGDRRAGFLAIAADELVEPDLMRSFLANVPSFPALLGSAAQ